MKITPAEIPEVLIVEPDVFGDARGFFMETWHAKKYAEHGLDVSFVQDNHSRSAQGVLRGLHYQREQAQGKLVRVSHGAVFDVAVDIRKGSPSFGRWVGVELSGENFKQLYVPPGFAHGFCVLSESADFIYKCTDFYAPEYEHSILWNDPDIGIDWPGSDFLVSEKDAQASRLKDMDEHLPVYEDP
ncbi:MAG TPA: dTDP-4-dehydrorhamnose 3,5-epimerase [Gammaproteobacteria bacterium]|nr:dTDP-4-dehydrorhamnose 3,5-epimerase [Gammaproteobacteria bacterium]